MSNTYRIALDYRMKDWADKVKRFNFAAETLAKFDTKVKECQERIVPRKFRLIIVVIFNNTNETHKFLEACENKKVNARIVASDL